jgi:hypothetical protein
MNNTNLIFLDIDGVLNHRVYYNEIYQNDRYKTIGYPMCNIDTKAIMLLNELIAKTRAKVVISSTWKKSNSLFYLKHLLGEMGFIGDIIGVTPSLYCNESKTSLPRGFEIKVWLKDNGYYWNNNYNYVILDDDSDMLMNQQQHFVYVDNCVGLTKNTIYKAINKLKGIY